MKVKYLLILICLLSFFVTDFNLLCFAMDPPLKQGTASSGLHEIPDDCTFAELEQFGQEIINLFPPDQYLYIGIGRSPAPVIAWLQMKTQAKNIVQIPLSEFRLCTPIDSDNIGLPEFPSDDARAKLFRHFDNYLRMNSGFHEKWLVIDVAESGNTLRSAGFALKEYAAEHKLDNSIEMLAIAENNHEKQSYLEMGMHVAMAQYNPGVDCYVTALEYFLIFGPGKKYAPYGELNWADLLSASTVPKVSTTSTSYDIFLKLVQKWAKSVELSVFWVITLNSISSFDSFK